MPDETTFNAGDTVHHTVFGRGVIEGTSDSSGFGRTLRIKFERFGLKEMLLTFAAPKLTKESP